MTLEKEKMKQFLAIYLASQSNQASAKWAALSESERQEREATGKSTWMNWVMKNSDSIVNHGSPIGKTMRTDKTGVSNTKNLITAYTIVQAESHEAAAKLFENHPHFMIFPGDSVEIMECLPMPKL